MKTFANLLLLPSFEQVPISRTDCTWKDEAGNETKKAGQEIVAKQCSNRILRTRLLFCCFFYLTESRII